MIESGTSEKARGRLREIENLVRGLGFLFLIIVLGLVIYFDDIQLTDALKGETPTIYNIRVGGIKILDLLSIFLGFLLIWHITLSGKIAITPFHKYIAIIFLVYCYAALIGFVYSFLLRYDYVIWIQDFQQTIYLVGFSVFTFYFVDTKTKWNVFVVCFLTFLAAKNVLITYNTLTGIGKAIGDWAFRASQNAEFTYFPMMFFPFVLLLFNTKYTSLKVVLALLVVVYLFNSFVGIYRTVWVTLILGTCVLLFHVEHSVRVRLVLWAGAAIVLTTAIVGMIFPRFLELAWSFKFASIFSWSLEGDRSNATRLLEIINITDYVFRHLAFLHGMGLGAWWDDEARRLLADFGSGFSYRTRYHTGHIWFVTQVLKIGLIGMVFYWHSVYRLIHNVSMTAKQIPWHRWERSVLAGLGIGLICAFISSADFVRMFLIIGVNVGITSRYAYLER